MTLLVQIYNMIKLNRLITDDGFFFFFFDDVHDR